MKKILVLILSVLLMLTALSLTVYAEAASSEEICVLADNMDRVEYKNNTYLILSENVNQVNGPKTELKLNASSKVTEEYEKIEASLHNSADYIISVVYDSGFEEKTLYYIREDNFADVCLVADGFTAELFNVGYTNFNITFAQKQNWEYNAVKHELSPELVNFDESFAMLSSDADGVLWFNAGRIYRVRKSDGVYKYYMLDYKNYGLDCFDKNGKLDMEYIAKEGKKVFLLELTDQLLADNITTGILEDEDEPQNDFNLDEDYDEYYEYDENVSLFGPMSDTAIAIIFGIFFALIPIVIGTISFGALIKRAKRPYDKILKVIISACAVIVICYLTVLLILAL